jgi:ATP-binding cassette subfamily B (MDR/TAP) protein 1
MLVSAFAVAFSQSWELTLVMLGVVILTMGLMGFIVGNDQKLEAGLLKEYEECSLVAEEALGSIKTVVAFGAIDKFVTKYQRILTKAKDIGKKKGPFVGMMFAAQYFFMFVAWALGFWFGAWLYSSGRISDPGRILS